MSYAQAEKASRLAAFYNAVQLAAFYNAVTTFEEATYFKEITYLKALAAQRSAPAASPAPAPPTPVATASLPAPAGGVSDATSTDTADWACIRQHESGGNYASGGGGAYQFELGTWEGLTGLSTPAEDSPPSVQDAAALRLFAERGWEPWTTRYVCGL